MKRVGPRLPLIVLILFASAICTWIGMRPVNVFPHDASGLVIKPILQLGYEPSPAVPAIATTPSKILQAIPAPSSLSVCWAIVPDPAGSTVKSKWSCMFTTADGWKEAPITQTQHVSYSRGFDILTAKISGLPANEKFGYRILKDQAILCQAQTKMPPDRLSPCRFAVVGDIGSGSADQRHVAYQIGAAAPQMVLLAGDIVYTYGTLSDYFTRLFPVWNSDNALPAEGAPILRSALCVAVPGNHDIANVNSVLVSNLNLFPDGLAYFRLWHQPLNGPKLGDCAVPLSGDKRQIEEFKKESELSFPNMTNYSFDYGCAHWTVLDANPQVDWTKKELVDWLKNDLSATQQPWKFVIFHQPGFASGTHHFSGIL